MRRLVVAGTGIMSEPAIVDTIVQMAGKPAPSVLYLGVASYDDPASEEDQCRGLVGAGCRIASLRIATETPAMEEIRTSVERADIVLVGYGNTLFAVDRIVKLGLDRLLREAMQRGAVMCGGSAGAIVWFDGGYSDSRDPVTFKNPDVDLPEELANGWRYIRAPALGFLPGLVCPHHDSFRITGVLRADDFDAMLRRHPKESGLGIDNFAVMVVDGDSYRVLSIKGARGSVGADGSFCSGGEGRPGIWKKTLGDSGEIRCELVPASGQLADIVSCAVEIVQDAEIADARRENPDDGIPA